MPALRQQILSAARRLGVEPQLRAVQRASLRGMDRRNAVDDEHLALLLALWLPAGARTVDCGANVGEILAQLVALAPEGRHVAFEPQPDLAAALRARFPDVEVHEAALGATAGEATFHQSLDHPARSSLAASADAGTTRAITVAVERLDDVLPRDFAPDFVKIDVEDTEAEMLEGARETLAAHRPIVALEHGIETGTTARVVEILGGDAGLRIFTMDGDGPLTLAQMRALEGRCWNWIAHR